MGEELGETKLQALIRDILIADIIAAYKRDQRDLDRWADDGGRP